MQRIVLVPASGDVDLIAEPGAHNMLLIFEKARLAEIELGEGNYDGARQQIERAVAILEPLREATVCKAARAYGVFAKTLLDMGRPAEAAAPTSPSWSTRK
jgi:hypothetical protein